MPNALKLIHPAKCLNGCPGLCQKEWGIALFQKSLKIFSPGGGKTPKNFFCPPPMVVIADAKPAEPKKFLKTS